MLKKKRTRKKERKKERKIETNKQTARWIKERYKQGHMEKGEDEERSKN